MLSGVQRIGLAGLMLAGIAIGGVWGLLSIPPSETAIIEAAVADYVAETGGVATDCAARPSSLPEVRLVVVCGSDWARAVDEMGRTLALDPDVLAVGT
jgi:hypothetical protein